MVGESGTKAKDVQLVVKGIPSGELQGLVRDAKNGAGLVTGILSSRLGRDNTVFNPVSRLIQAIEVEETGFVIRGLTPAQYKLLIRAASYGLDELSQTIYQTEAGKIKPLCEVKALIRSMENGGTLLNEAPPPIS